MIDLLNNRVEGEIGLGFFIAAFSTLKRSPPAAALLVLGDLSVQGNIKSVRSLVEPLQVAKDNGAKRALIPIENKRSFLEVTGDVVECRSHLLRRRQYCSFQGPWDELTPRR